MAALSQESFWDLYMPDAAVPQSQRGEQCQHWFLEAVLVSAGILGQWPIGRLADSLVDCWCCVFRSLSSFSAVSDA